MTRALFLPASCSLLLLLAAAPAAQEPDVATVGAATEPVALDGTLIPAEAEAVSFWPEAWSGELLFLEVAAHGSLVAAGQVIARCDPRGIDEQLRAEEEELGAARVNHRLAAAKAELEERAAVERAELAEAALRRAHQGLADFHGYELPARRAQAELSEQRTRDNLADQEDELAQLEAMYRADELTDATEDIVLMRSRRELERSRHGAELARAARAHQQEFDWARELEVREEELRKQQSAFERLQRELELDRAGRRDRLEREERELQRKEEKLARLRHDRENFELRAPRDGVLLHGAIDDYRPGAAPPRHARGTRAQLRTDLFCVAAPDRFAVAVKVGESQLARAPRGAKVRIEPVVATDRAIAGVLRLESFPLPDSARGPENQYAGTVTVDGPLHGWAPGMRAKVVVTEGS